MNNDGLRAGYTNFQSPSDGQPTFDQAQSPAWSEDGDLTGEDWWSYDSYDESEDRNWDGEANTGNTAPIPEQWSVRSGNMDLMPAAAEPAVGDSSDVWARCWDDNFRQSVEEEDIDDQGYAEHMAPSHEQFSDDPGIMNHLATATATTGSHFFALQNQVPYHSWEDAFPDAEVPDFMQWSDGPGIQRR